MLNADLTIFRTVKLLNFLCSLKKLNKTSFLFSQLIKIVTLNFSLFLKYEVTLKHLFKKKNLMYFAHLVNKFT